MTEFPETAVDETEALPPVRMSGEAQRTLAGALRRWSGWPKATVKFTVPEGVKYASTLRDAQEFSINVDALTRNPHRVLVKVTPFRMRQEAVLTGAMLHEAGHARHSRWRPVTAAQNALFKHGFGSEHEGEEVNKPTRDFATLMEEARIEGLIHRNAGVMGAVGLPWTMRVAASTIYPMTTLSADPDQQIMDVISAYTLRAGRLISACHWVEEMEPPPWVIDFQILLQDAISHYLSDKGVDNAAGISAQILAGIHEMYNCSDDTGTFMVDKAREVLDLLFPETDPDEVPSPSGGCEAAGAGLPDHELDESEDEDEGEVSEASDTDTDTGSDTGTDTGSKLARLLAQVESRADRETQATAQSETEAAPKEELPQQVANSQGAGNSPFSKPSEGKFRVPTAGERQVKTGAERFLRTLIDPTVTRKIKTTSQPSSTLDAAAYAAWKANGGRGEPTFFRQIKRTITQAPPVRIMILRDVSESMAKLTEPSALLAWSVAAAAYDLRNFAGRGVQIESCLINWGSYARVIQHNGEMLRGVFESECKESTHALGPAFDLGEQEMPGFFDIPEVPTSRLIVHFTDWRLGNMSGVDKQVAALHAGVNTLSVLPKNTRMIHGEEVRRLSVGAPGKFEVMAYDHTDPGAVWTKAAQMLDPNNKTGE